MIPYCHDHDPLIRAGSICCGTCGGLGYPTDAAWLDDGRILATFGAVCQHGPDGGTWIIDPAEYARHRNKWCHRPTKDGGRCRNRSRNGRPCRIHEQQQ